MEQKKKMAITAAAIVAPRKKKMAITAAAIVAAVVIIDQVIKILVKTNMPLYGDIELASWSHIRFVENNGMAFGMEFIPKFVLTLFRIVVVAWVVSYVVRIIRNGTATLGYVACLAVIVAGAIGNIVDCMFYGLVFGQSTPDTVASFVPFGDGYGSFLNGRVVDMFYFPLFEFDWPSWVPFVGDDHFVFFSPVFNFADAAITCGIATLLLFFRSRLLKKS